MYKTRPGGTSHNASNKQPRSPNSPPAKPEDVDNKMASLVCSASQHCIGGVLLRSQRRFIATQNHRISQLIANYCFQTRRISASSHVKRRRSPYSVLNISSNANNDEIKSAFRQLVKQHHPDTKRQSQQRIDSDDSEDDTIMVDLIHAYETLMNKHKETFLTDDMARDSRVSLACEMYSIEELRRMHHLFDVYSFRVSFTDALGNDDTQKSQYEHASKENEATSKQQQLLDSPPIMPLQAHPDDSISDVKRKIQSQFAPGWGLEGRRLDRDGIQLGWELVHVTNQDDAHVLSYHLFLHSYDIQDGSVLHAVVRKENV